MDVWVAGATGVLGRRVVRQLLDAGHAVTGLARDLSKWPGAPAEMRFIPCDITLSGNVIQAFGSHKPEAILHLATAMPAGRPTAKDWQRNDAVRRAGTQNLTEAALLSDSYYVQQSVHYVMAPHGDAWITEESPFYKSPALESAIDAERITNRAFQQGMRGCVVRPAMFYSGDSTQIRVIAHALKSGMPMQVGPGTNYWSLVHPDDVAAAILLALQVQPPSETFNLADDEPVHMAECLKWLAQALHAHPPKSVAPMFAKMALGGEMVDLLTGSRRVSNAKAKAELGWQPRYPTFREGFSAELDQLKTV